MSKFSLLCTAEPRKVETLVFASNFDSRSLFRRFKEKRSRIEIGRENQSLNFSWFSCKYQPQSKKCFTPGKRSFIFNCGFRETIHGFCSDLHPIATLTLRAEGYKAHARAMTCCVCHSSPAALFSLSFRQAGPNIKSPIHHGHEHGGCVYVEKRHCDFDSYGGQDLGRTRDSGTTACRWNSGEGGRKTETETETEIVPERECTAF